MKNNLFLLFLFISTSAAIGQVSYEKRIEFELKDGYENENIIEFGEDGFLMSSKNGESSGKEREWKYELFNADLQSVDTKTIMLPKKYRSDETYSTDERAHTLYKDRKGNYSLLTINVAPLSITKVEGQIPKKTFVEEMAILGDYAYFNTLVKKKPFLFSINWKTGEHNIIPINLEGYNRERIDLMSFQVLKEANEILLYAKVHIANRQSAIFVIRLNDRGVQEEVFNLTKEVEKNLVDISASKLREGKYIFTGTYSTKFTSVSEGLFFCQVHQKEIDFMKFYNFLDLKNFLAYLPERKQERIEKKKERKKGRGKELVINYRLATHEVILLADGYLFLGEAYYPTYRTETYTTTSTSNGVTTTTTHTRTVFDGYRYTHAVIAKFSSEGTLVWDESFEMWPAYKPFVVKKFIATQEKSEHAIKLVFASRSRIVSKSIKFDGQVIHDFESEEIETIYSGDRSKMSFSNIEFWYGSYFIAFGSQKIKNKLNEKVKRKRKVYFVNKIKFE